MTNLPCRYSPAAQQLRKQMRSMKLTPEQFRDLFNALNSIIGQPVYFYTGTDALAQTAAATPGPKRRRHPAHPRPRLLRRLPTESDPSTAPPKASRSE